MTTPELVANADVFLWALYDMGGEGKFVDVEDVFEKAFELAPQRFSWRTRPNLPDLKKCSKSLQEAEVRVPKLLVKNGPYLRMLSVEGQNWIEVNFERLVSVLDQTQKIRPSRRGRPSKLVSLAKSSDVYRIWKDTSKLSSEKWQLAQLLNCSIDSTPAIWSRRLEELRSAAFLASEETLQALLDRMKEEQKELFANG